MRRSVISGELIGVVLNKFNKTEQVVWSTGGGICEPLCDVGEGIWVVREGDGLIFSSFVIAVEGDIEPGDLLCWVAGICLCCQVKCEVSSSERLSIDGDREGIFDVIELSSGL